jgi:hypothetical protein
VLLIALVVACGSLRPGSAPNGTTLQVENLACANIGDGVSVSGDVVNRGGRLAQGVVVTADVTDQLGNDHGGSFKFTSAISPGHSVPFTFDVLTGGRPFQRCDVRVTWNESSVVPFG